MLFGYVPPTVRVPNLLILGENIHNSEKSNFLGIVIDQKLTFEAHVNELLTKLSRVSGVLWRSRNLAPKTVRKSIYFSLAWSNLIYGILAWGRSNVTNVKRLGESSK